MRRWRRSWRRSSSSLAASRSRPPARSATSSWGWGFLAHEEAPGGTTGTGRVAPYSMAGNRPILGVGERAWVLAPFAVDQAADLFSCGHDNVDSAAALVSMSWTAMGTRTTATRNT